eukprot:TRINITY_DN753_c0_g2_i1.p1 TRINITY_DN753_c0_g2~~TRINITY_DN753_c0_g2_i1.p1  ORF type:complete len:800 (-),score=196.58 TRINITY_DN753_c0_g2_i1:92-2491(-)
MQSNLLAFFKNKPKSYPNPPTKRALPDDFIAKADKKKTKQDNAFEDDPIVTDDELILKPSNHFNLGQPTPKSIATTRTSDTSTIPSVNVFDPKKLQVCWSWLSDADGWKLYSSEINEQIEKSFNSPLKPIVKIDDQRFIDISKMVQKRYDNPTKQRIIQRKTDTNPSSTSSGSKSQSQRLEAKWLWQSETGWTPYLPELAEKLEKSFQSGRTNVDIDALRFVSVKTMLQLRKDNQAKSRMVKRIVSADDKNVNNQKSTWDSTSKSPLRNQGIRNNQLPANKETSSLPSTWAWQGNDLKWLTYSSEICKKLETEYKKPKKDQKNVLVDDQRYVDVMTMSQYRFDSTAKKRPVRRETTSWSSTKEDTQKSGKEEKIKKKDEKKVVWMRQGDKDWIEFEEKLQEKIEKAFLLFSSSRSKDSRRFKLDDLRYIDFLDMVQKRFDNENRKRWIRRLEKDEKGLKGEEEKPEFTTQNLQKKDNKPTPKVHEPQKSKWQEEENKEDTSKPGGLYEDDADEEEFTTILQKQVDKAEMFKRTSSNSNLDLKKKENIDEYDSEEGSASVSSEKTEKEKKREARRTLYKCKGNFYTIDDVPSWSDWLERNQPDLDDTSKQYFPPSSSLNEKISLWRGDITALEIDAIVNAAKASLLGGGGVDGAIHVAAGKGLYYECKTLNGCDVGAAKITMGHRLPAEYVIHTVGPIGEDKAKLKSCYRSSLQLLIKSNLRSIAFCCISTGIYGYPNDKAAHVTLKTVRKWLHNKANASKVDRIIFCVFMEKDVKLYEHLMPQYFPPVEDTKKVKEKDG